MRWPLAKLEEVALPGKGAVVSGPFGSNISSRFFVAEGVPVIRGNNLTFGERRFVDDGFVFLTEEKAQEFRNCEAITDDLVFTAAGTIGQVGIIPSAARFERYIISNKQLRVRCDRNKVNPLFLFQWFTTLEMRQHIINKNTGCSIPLINLGILRGLPVPLPSLEVQDRIASTLSTYDDLIENNRRRIVLLEEATRQVYQEWFVRLSFPGHEHTRIVDGVPEGWERISVPEIIDINPKVQVESGKQIYYVPMSSLSEVGMTVDSSGFENRTSHTAVKFRKEDVLLARITPCLENGKTAFVHFLDENEVACGSTEFIVLRGRRVSPYFTYCLARSYDFRENAIKSMVGSSGRQRVQTSCFEKFALALPPNTLLSQFDETAKGCFAQIANLTKQNQKLRVARNLLLPKLMSGEIAV
ncbi:MAG: restriction endonuclease subunit S [Deltaproteobacteria bacterium]|nr:MAG: restriction endonuclease subunit S [Deltaproteobacteria bacterium]